MSDMTSPEAGTYVSPFKLRYDNFIGGEFVPPFNGRYFENLTAITGGMINECARSDAADVKLALDAAHAAKNAWAKTPATDRFNIVLKIADRIDRNWPQDHGSDEQEPDPVTLDLGGKSPNFFLSDASGAYDRWGCRARPGCTQRPRHPTCAQERAAMTGDTAAR